MENKRHNKHGSAQDLQRFPSPNRCERASTKAKLWISGYFHQRELHYMRKG
jgi:hypothetical protein